MAEENAVRGLASQPVRWVFHACLLLGLALWLWAYSAPGLFVVLWAFTIWGLAALGFVWLVRLVLFWRRAPGGRGRRWFALAPAMVLVVVALGWSGAALRVRWELSQGRFEAIATSDDPADAGAGRIGLYRVDRVADQDGMVLFYVSGSGLFDSYGFAYAPDGVAPRDLTGVFDYEAFDGDWYVFRETF